MLFKCPQRNSYLCTFHLFQHYSLYLFFSLQWLKTMFPLFIKWSGKWEFSLTIFCNPLLVCKISIFFRAIMKCAFVLSHLSSLQKYFLENTRRNIFFSLFSRKAVLPQYSTLFMQNPQIPTTQLLLLPLLLLHQLHQIKAKSPLSSTKDRKLASLTNHNYFLFSPLVAIQFRSLLQLLLLLLISSHIQKNIRNHWSWSYVEVDHMSRPDLQQEQGW